MFWKQHLPQLERWDPPFPGGEKAWRRVTADVTVQGASLYLQLQLGCAHLQFNTSPAPSHTSQGSQDFHLAPVQVMFSRGAAGLVSSPSECWWLCCHRCHTSPGPLRASASFQSPLNKGFLGKLEKCFSAKVQTCSTSPPHSLQSSGFEGNKERNTDLSDPALHHCVFTVLCLSFYGKG